MWSCHIYWGFGFGFEFYEAELEFEDGSKDPISYLLINIGPIRIQRGEYIWARAKSLSGKTRRIKKMVWSNRRLCMSLYENINKRKKAGTSRTKKKSTVTKAAYANMKAGFPKKKKKKA